MISCKAGSVLETLAAANIDLVLHGHEHEPHLADYGSVRGRGSWVRVLAAGSATGNDSLEGCSLNRATFNVLVLREDRSVWLRRMEYKAPDWVYEEKQLLSPAMLRRSRVRRLQSDREVDVELEVTKSVEFTREGDIVVYMEYRNWRPKGREEFELEIGNSTGEPVLLENRKMTVEVDGNQPYAVVPTLDNRGCPEHAWKLRWEVPQAERDKRLTIRFGYRWERGAFLTLEELERYRGRGPVRDRKLEFATARVREPAAGVDVTVLLPQEYAGVKPFVQVAEGPPDGRICPHQTMELQDSLRTLGTGQYGLRVAFPHVDRNYQIAWKPCSEQDVQRNMDNQEAAGRFGETATGHGRELLAAFLQPLAGVLAKETMNVGLYVAEPAHGRLQRVADGLALGCAPAECPSPIPEIGLNWLDNAVVATRSGVPTIILGRPKEEDATKLGFHPAEQAVIVLPIRFSLVSPVSPPPWGFVRIGVVGTAGEDLSAVNADDRLSKILSAGVTSLLTAALLQM
jgi:hypothetical protein